MQKLFGIEWYRLRGEDYRAIFMLICCLLGVGTLSMPGNLGKSGLAAGLFGIVSVSLINIYASVLLSLCVLRMPSHVLTYTDMGRYIGGFWGELAVHITQLGTCLMLPVVFFILGGSLLLPTIFSSVVDLDVTTWIFLMAATLLPIILIRKLEEAYWVTLVGTATTFGAYVIAIGDSATNQTWKGFDYPIVEFLNVCSVFGAIALSFGAAIFTPSLHRSHDNERAIPAVLVITLSIMSSVYVFVGLTGYLQFGCSAPANLLVSMTPGILQLLAFVLMQAHVMMAVCTILNPALFAIERHLFGFYDSKAQAAADLEAEKQKQLQITSPGAEAETSVCYISPREVDEPDAITLKQRLKSCLFRTVLMFVLAFLASLSQDCFEDVLGFVGATTVTGSCVIIPCLFYLATFRRELTFAQKFLCVAIVLFSACLGGYSAYEGLSVIVRKAATYSFFSQSKSAPAEVTYPYCPSGYSFWTSE